MNPIEPCMEQQRISNWMAVMAIFIFIMIGVGGYTRLSESGLSIVSWKPVTGWIPPLSESQWQDEFLAYQKTPEYLKVNHQMDLASFKSIFVVEYFHRLLGRLLGLVFFIPYLYFIFKKVITGRKIWLYLGLGLLGGAQGLMGWLMVKSGLVDDPNVSAYRLCAHLMLGALLFWICGIRFAKERWNSPWPKFKLYYLAMLVVALQIASGAFVSGKEAGHAFPALWYGMGSGMWASSLGFRNFFENVITIIFHHISLATVVFTTLFVYAKSIKVNHPKGFHLVTVVLGVQVLLGISALYFYNPQRPLVLCLMHQMVAFVLLGVVTLVPLWGKTKVKTN